jgi:hypothetical protein
VDKRREELERCVRSEGDREAGLLTRVKCLRETTSYAPDMLEAGSVNCHVGPSVGPDASLVGQVDPADRMEASSGPVALSAHSTGNRQQGNNKRGCISKQKTCFLQISIMKIWVWARKCLTL